MMLGKTSRHTSTALNTVSLVQLSGILFRHHLVRLIELLGEQCEGQFTLWKDTALLNSLPLHHTVQSIYCRGSRVGWK